MPKEEQIVTEGTVTEVLPGTMFRVDLAGQRNVLAHISGKMRKHFIRIVPGDKVSVERSPYDLTKARPIFREQYDRHAARDLLGVASARIAALTKSHPRRPWHSLTHHHQPPIG